MLKVKINGNKGIVEVECGGSLPELMADVTTVLSCMYEGINKNQKEDFKRCIKHLADDELYTKTQKEVAELNKKKEEEIKEKIKNELEKLINDLFGKKE